MRSTSSIDLDDGRVLLSHLGMSGRYTLFDSDQAASAKPLLQTVNGGVPVSSFGDETGHGGKHDHLEFVLRTAHEPSTPTRAVSASSTSSLPRTKPATSCWPRWDPSRSTPGMPGPCSASQRAQDGHQTRIARPKSGGGRGQHLRLRIPLSGWNFTRREAGGLVRKTVSQPLGWKRWSATSRT